jgi:hypothetical protein
MDPETKKLLQEIHALTEDNHHILREMRRAQVWGFFGKIVFWILIVVGPLYFLLPYLGALPSASQLQDVLKVYTTGQSQ